MSMSNNAILALTLALLFISIFGTVITMNSMDFVAASQGPTGNPAVQQGQIHLNILPGPTSDVATGLVAINILPDEE